MSSQQCVTAVRRPGVAWPRKSARTSLNAEVLFKRSGQINYRVRILDLSRHGCKIECVQRPRVGEAVWVKIEGLESLESVVCWIDGFVAGVEFQKPLHAAVFDLLLSRVK